MTKINHLTFDPELFLSILDNTFSDEIVYYLHPTCERIWKGSQTKDYVLIECLLEDHEDTEEIRDLYKILLGEIYPKEVR